MIRLTGSNYVPKHINSTKFFLIMKLFFPPSLKPAYLKTFIFFCPKNNLFCRNRFRNLFFISF
jgi:hypothetical protein